MSTAGTRENLDPVQVAAFERHADHWWDPDGPLRTLHALNPVRLRYIDAAVRLAGKRVLDAGCGGGLLCEAMAARGATVTGLDAGTAALDTARAHAQLSGAAVEYVHGTVEAFAASGRVFDVVTCMELLEHVPDPESLVRGCARLLVPGGDLVISTINRNLRSWLGAIVAAEYLLGLVPRGTHRYSLLLRPAEVRHMLARHGFAVIDIAGMHYLPWVNRCTLGNDPGINYIVHARRASPR